jgi:hypothetical protein
LKGKGVCQEILLRTHWYRKGFELIASLPKTERKKGGMKMFAIR